MASHFQRYARHEHLFIQMTTGQSDKDSRKSEHETLQLRYLNNKPTTLHSQTREEVLPGSEPKFNG